MATITTADTCDAHAAQDMGRKQSKSGVQQQLDQLLALLNQQEQRFPVGFVRAKQLIDMNYIASLDDDVKPENLYNGIMSFLLDLTVDDDIAKNYVQTAFGGKYSLSHVVVTKWQKPLAQLREAIQQIRQLILQFGAEIIETCVDKTRVDIDAGVVYILRCIIQRHYHMPQRIRQ